MTGLQAVDLVDRDHDRDAQAEHSAGDESVAGADPVARGGDEEDGVDALEGGVDRPLHVLGQGIARALEARQVGEDQLVVLAVRDPEDATARRLRLVGDNRDLAAAERVDERRLADVRPARDGDKARLQRTNVSGSSSSGVCATSSPSLFAYTTRSTLNSTCHWRQPPHGEALITIRSKSPAL